MFRSKTKTLPDQSGFTLIELISVIVVLGVLSAIALPRFLDLSEDAHVGTARSTLGSFRSAVNVFQSAWLARGEPAAVEGIIMNANGFPGPINPTTPDCIAIWGMMDTTYGINTFTAIPAIPVGQQSWSTIAFGGVCVYIYDTDITPLKAFSYITNSGVIVSNFSP